MISPAQQTAAPQSKSRDSREMETLLAAIPIKRITDQIRLHWGLPECDVYLNSLLVNDRDRQRAGFAPEVSSAIFALLKLNEQQHPVRGNERVIEITNGIAWAPPSGH